MKFFPKRKRQDAGQSPTSPLDRAMALYAGGHYAEAEAEARFVAEARSAMAGGRDDAYVPLARGVAALAMGAQGRHADACAAYDAVLPVFGRIFGAEHPQTLKIRSDRAQQLAAVDRHAECEEECRAVLSAAARGAAPELRFLVAAARNGLVYALTAQGRHEEAEPVAREALAAHPEQDRFALVLRLGLTRSLNGQGRHEEALAEARRAGEVYRSLPQERRRAETGAVELVEATALSGLGRGADARARAVAAHDACVAAFGPEHWRTKEAQELLDRIDRLADPEVG